MPRRSSDFGPLARAALAAGVVGAVVEMLFVLPIQQIVLHNAPLVVFQGIASGAVGEAAASRGGWTTGAEGVFWHLLVSVIAAAIYALAARRWDILLRRPVLGGIGLGVGAYVVMTFIVIPLSAIGPQPYRPNVLTLVSFLIHLFAFGVPIALTLRLMLLRRKLELAS